MYCATVTPHPVRFYSVVDNVTSIDATVPNSMTITTSSVDEVRTVRKEIIVIRAAPPSEFEFDFEEKAPPPKHRLVLKPLIPARKAPLQAKWRLMQQRPRDGLHS